jgi:CHAT domain-containing protein
MRRLVVVPHGALHQVPFHALVWRGSWLSDAFEVVHAPSAASYRRCGDARPTATGVPAVFGLPDASAPRIDEECRRVARAVGKSNLYVRDEATFERLRTSVERARVVHIAAHGMIRRGHPMLSSIRLADRGLELYDLYDMTARGELIVLSTCENDAADPDEIVGLTLGLLHAGAPAVVTNRWAVDDAVAGRFMECFHQAVRRGSGAAAAHRRAMAAIRERRPHPYFWAPYFLSGCPADARRRAPSKRGESDAELTTPTTAARRGRALRKGSIQPEERT